MSHVIMNSKRVPPWAKRVITYKKGASRELLREIKATKVRSRDETTYHIIPGGLDATAIPKEDVEILREISNGYITIIDWREEKRPSKLRELFGCI